MTGVIYTARIATPCQGCVRDVQWFGDGSSPQSIELPADEGRPGWSVVMLGECRCKDRLWVCTVQLAAEKGLQVEVLYREPVPEPAAT